MREKIGIIDTEVSNIKSILNLLNYLKVDFELILENFDNTRYDKLILPGVGNVGQFIKNLETRKLINPINNFIEQNKPFLGICLGMQFLFEKSEEDSLHNCLGILKGTVKKFPIIDDNDTVPLIGKRKIFLNKELKEEEKKFGEIHNSKEFYFLHSYYCLSEKKNELFYSNHNGIRFTSGIIKKNLIGVQFHPEKSSDNGVSFMKNFLNF